MNLKMVFNEEKAVFETLAQIKEREKLEAEEKH